MQSLRVENFAAFAKVDIDFSPGFLALYENHYTKFDETWRDTCQLLGALVGRGRLFGDEPETNLNPTVDTVAAVPWAARLRAVAA